LEQAESATLVVVEETLEVEEERVDENVVVVETVVLELLLLVDVDVLVVVVDDILVLVVDDVEVLVLVVDEDVLVFLVDVGAFPRPARISRCVSSMAISLLSPMTAAETVRERAKKAETQYLENNITNDG
jgi:hypothetical protein